MLSLRAFSVHELPATLHECVCNNFLLMRKKAHGSVSLGLGKNSQQTKQTSVTNHYYQGLRYILYHCISEIHSGLGEGA